MKKFFAAGLAAALIAGVTAFTQATPVSDMDIDVSGLAQFNYNWSERNGDDDQLDTARMRLNIEAMPDENIGLYTAIELTNNQMAVNNTVQSRIVDLYVDLTYLYWTTVRVGQFPLPISYELNTPEYELETIRYSMSLYNPATELALVDTTPTTSTAAFGERDRGIMFMGDPFPEFGWAAWAVNGDAGATIEGANVDADDQTAFGLQLNWRPLKNLSFKGWGMAQSESSVTLQSRAFGLGFNYTYRGFHLFGEYNDARLDNAGGVGVDNDVDQFMINASYKIPDTDLQIVARYDNYDANQAAASTDVNCTTAGINWDFEKNARLQLMREFWEGSNTDRTDLMLSVKF